MYDTQNYMLRFMFPHTGADNYPFLSNICMFHIEEAREI